MSAMYKPRRLRMMDKGAENITSRLGMVDFVDGVSTAPVTYLEAMVLGGIYHLEDADEPGYQISPASQMLRGSDFGPENSDVVAFGNCEHVNVDGSPVIQRYTAEELEGVADKEGLAGVREIARAWGQTGRSIKECIDAVLLAQGDNVASRIA